MKAFKRDQILSKTTVLEPFQNHPLLKINFVNQSLNYQYFYFDFKNTIKSTIIIFFRRSNSLRIKIKT